MNGIARTVLMLGPISIGLISIELSAQRPTGRPGALAAARAYHTEHGAKILREFADLLTIPNVASDRANNRRTAEWARDAFARRGAKMELLELEGAPPIVYGTLTTANAVRTLGVYIHYDGQPVDASRWTDPPWQPTLRTRAIEAGGERRALPRAGEAIDPEWRLYARSAGDDKAPIIAWLAALDALASARVERSVNLLFFFEGEEEAGSRRLRHYVERYRDRLDVDGWLICDGPVHPSRRPQLVFGVRGITSLELTVYGATRPLHSGHYGNWAPNPAMRLAHLLASMKDDDGNVKVAGFYDDVAPVGAGERRAIDALPDNDAELRAELGLARTELDDAPLAERLLLPTLNVRGLAAANVGARARNVIPKAAIAAIDIRLVKGNRPERMLALVEAHVRKQGYHVVREEPDLATRRRHAKIALIRRGGGYGATRTSMSDPVVRDVIAAARRVSGRRLVLMPSLGGSLPLFVFPDLLGDPAVIVPIANHDDNQHAPDENLRIANLWYGIDLFAVLMTK